MTELLKAKEIEYLKDCLHRGVLSPGDEISIATIEAQQAQIQSLTHERDAYRGTLLVGIYPYHSAEYNRQLDAKISELKEKNEAQQAQIKGLVGALEQVNYCAELAIDHVRDAYGPDREPTQAVEGIIEECDKALKTLPASFLERERAREAVIEAASKRYLVESIAWITDCANGGTAAFREYWADEDKELFSAVEALEALEGGV